MTATATGFVVAGGRSRRMGRDKALLPWGPGTLLDLALHRLRTCCRQVRILSGPRVRYAERGVPVDPDVVSGAGPLGGLLTGLLHLRGEPGLFLAVDLPYVPTALLAHLLELAEGFDAVVPVCAGGPQPLCALYQATCLAPVQRRLEAGDLKMTAFWPEVAVRQVTEEEVAFFGEPVRLFRNINTPEDLPDSAP